jgi:hypothetical protein
MKKIILLVMLFTAIFQSVNGQTDKSKLNDEQKKELKAKMDEYRAKLNLSSDQQVKVEAINADYIEALSGIKGAGGSKMNRYKKFKQVKNERDKKMKEVLTREQYKIYKEQQQELKKEVKARRTR